MGCSTRCKRRASTWSPSMTPSQRLKQGDDRRFACFTFDDGYRDVAEHA